MSQDLSKLTDKELDLRLKKLDEELKNNKVYQVSQEIERVSKLPEGTRTKVFGVPVTVGEKREISMIYN